MNRLDHDEVRLRIQAPPELLYDLVSDVPRTPEWSPEVISCRWLDGAAGAVPGARFSARNKRRWAAWSNKPVVETAERGQEFAVTRGSEQVQRLLAITRIGEHLRIIDAPEELAP